MLSIQHRVNAIAQHRAQPHPKEPLAQEVFTRARASAGRVTVRDQIATQQLSQHLRVNPVGLDLGFGDQPGFVRMRQHHFLHLVDLGQQVVEPAPIPAGFHHHFALLA